MIKRSKPVEIDFKEEDIPDTYCLKCKAVGVYVLLKPRLYLQNEIVTDDENWRQCYRCGDLVENYNVRHDNNKLVPFSEPVNNPFDFGVSEIGGVTKRKLDYEDEEDIADDVKRELKKGSILLSYSNDMMTDNEND